MRGEWIAALFLALSIPAVAFSWPHLRQPRHHGFFRFFAFESILLLVLVNLSAWFAAPFAPIHLVSWILLVASGFLVVHAFHLLRTAGRPSGPIERTTVLVTAGAYRFIRHPLYASLLFLGWGAYLKDPTWLGTALVGVATASLVATARVEEAECLAKFGRAYAEYMQRTRRFVPYLF
jgi:protein-S-isoprenylcysteine O-methyltransferase Ste14